MLTLDGTKKMTQDESTFWNEILQCVAQINTAADRYFDLTNDGTLAAKARRHAFELANTVPVEVRAKHLITLAQ